MAKFTYIALFETNIIEDFSLPEGILIIEDVKVLVTKEKLSYKVPVQHSSILPRGGNTDIICSTKNIDFPEDKIYIELKAVTSTGNPIDAIRECEIKISRVVTILSTLLRVEYFENQLYRGWVVGYDGSLIMENWIKVIDKKNIDLTSLPADYSKISNKLRESDKLNSKFSLMSRFYLKSLSFLPGEERFLFLWTIFEIFPMQNTSNIKPLIIFLSEILNKPEQEVKSKLKIGILYGYRTRLVHDGEFKVDISIQGKIFTMMENMIFEVFRKMMGLPYEGRLDEYFQE